MPVRGANCRLLLNRLYLYRLMCLCFILKLNLYLKESLGTFAFLAFDGAKLNCFICIMAAIAACVCNILMFLFFMRLIINDY